MINSKYNLTRLMLSFGGFIVLIFFLKVLGFLQPIQSIVGTVTAPIFRQFYSFGNAVYLTFSQSSDWGELERENERLRQENIELKQKVIELQVDKQENIALRQLLDVFETDIHSLPRVVGRIIGRDPENSAILTIDVGQRDGVKINNAVIVQDGILVAKITNVLTRTSKALLLTDSQSSVATTISGGPPASKIAQGERGLSLILDQIPQQEIITPGQMVITSGLEPSIPKGLVVGEIEQIISERNDLFQRAVLKPLVDYQAIYYVAIILDNANI